MKIQLEHFNLKELKNIFKIIQNDFNILKNFKIYKLNKYDLICLLRNTRYFKENRYDSVLMKLDDIEVEFYPRPKKTAYRGNKIKGLTFLNKPVTLSFN